MTDRRATAYSKREFTFTLAKNEHNLANPGDLLAIVTVNITLHRQWKCAGDLEKLLHHHSPKIFWQHMTTTALIQAGWKKG